MIGDASVVGLGEATHGSHDFFALKHRVFRHLVEEKGFCPFALEAPWSTGLLLDDDVVHARPTRGASCATSSRHLPVVEQHRTTTSWSTSTRSRRHGYGTRKRPVKPPAPALPRPSQS
jgi:hypothetical protein